MTIHKKIWPDNRTPIKEEIERMYKCAYYIDRNFFRPQDLVDFGLDFYRMKEFGEIEMKKELSKLRPHVQALWDRMNPAQRTMFLYSYLVQGCNYVLSILGSVAPFVGDTKSEERTIAMLCAGLSRKFPQDLQEKLNEGFGKEWAFREEWEK